MKLRQRKQKNTLAELLEEIRFYINVDEFTTMTDIIVYLLYNTDVQYVVPVEGQWKPKYKGDGIQHNFFVYQVEMVGGQKGLVEILQLQKNDIYYLFCYEVEKKDGEYLIKEDNA